MSKHTPGPWIYKYGMVEAKTTLPLCYRHAPADGFDPLCSLTGYFGTEETQEANGLLMSAAPDLLEALEAVETLFGPLANDSTQKNWLEKACAAIAKAKGEKQ